MPPWEKYANPAGNYGPDPYKVNDEQRKQQAAALAAEAAARAAEAADRANNNSAVSNANSQEMTKLAREKFEFDKKKGGGAADTQKMANLRALERQIEEVRGLYNKDLKGGGLLESVGEYLPFAENRAFDSAGKALAETGFGAFRVPGVGSQSDAEGARFVEAYAPSASDQDSVIEQKITNLENRLRDTYREMGIEPRQPEQQDDAPMAAAMAGQPPAGPQDADQSSVVLGDPMQPDRGGFAPYGAKFRTQDNPALAGVNVAIGKMIAGGASRDQIMAFAASKGVQLDSGTRFGNETPTGRAWLKANPGKPYPVNVDDMTVPMSGFDQFRNNAPQTRVGTAAAMAGNAGGLGIPQMLAGGEGLDYLRSVNPKSAFVGDVAGVIGGTMGLGAVGGKVAGKFAPGLLGGGKRAALGRQVGTDATYGGIYGATTEGDPLTGAGTAALGSGIGLGIGKGLQKTFAGGGDLAAQALRGRGIPLTAGQALGGLPKRLEDAATSIPIVGDVINARRGEGMEAFNRVAFADAGAPIGASVNDIGDAGIDALRPQISRAYDAATEGLNIPLDKDFVGALANTKFDPRGLPKDLQDKYFNVRDFFLDQTVRPSGRPENIPLASIQRDSQGAGIANLSVDYAMQNGGFPANTNPASLVKLADGTPYLMDGFHRARVAEKTGQNTLNGSFQTPNGYTLERLANEGIPSNNMPDLGALDGNTYQQTIRRLKGYRSETTKPGFEEDYRTGIRELEDNLRSQVIQRGGEGVVSGLSKADAAYRNSKILGKAVEASRNGTRSGEVGVFAPSQLNDASVANARKFGGNGATENRPFYELATQGQAVLPSKIGDSGTPIRMLAGAGLLGTGTAGAGYAGADPATVAAPVGATALLALLGTKKGQKMLVKGLMDRPEVLKKAGGLIGRRKAQRAIGSAGAGLGIGALPYFE